MYHYHHCATDLLSKRFTPNQFVAGAEAASLLDLLPPLGEPSTGWGHDDHWMTLSLKYVKCQQCRQCQQCELQLW